MELEIEDLRVGGLFYLENPKYYQDLKGVPMKLLSFNETIGIDKEDTFSVTIEKALKDKFEFPQTYSQFIKFLKPIPLTEKLLLKNGATKDKDVLIFDRFRLKYYQQYKYWYISDNVSLTYFTKVEYIHEWQSFLKVVNGTNLTINL